MGCSGAGAGSLADIDSGADVGARVGATSSVSSNGAIVVTATADSDATANSDIGSGGLVAIGVAVPTARIGGTTRAEFSGDITKGDALSVTATGTYDAIASATPVTIGLIAAAGARSYAEIQAGASVEAHIGPEIGIEGGSDRPTINVAGGAVLVKAAANMHAKAESDSASGGAFTLAVMLPEAKVNGATRAYVREGTAIDAGSLDVQAGTSGNKVIYKAEATSMNLAIGLIAGVGVEAVATTSGVVEAFIGAPAGATTGFASAGPTLIDVGSALLVRAYSDMDAIANVGAGSGGGVAISALVPTADVAGTTRAYVGQGADIHAPSLDIDANGDLNADRDHQGHPGQPGERPDRVLECHRQWRRRCAYRVCGWDDADLGHLQDRRGRRDHDRRRRRDDGDTEDRLSRRRDIRRHQRAVPDGPPRRDRPCVCRRGRRHRRGLGPHRGERTRSRRLRRRKGCRLRRPARPRHHRR